MATFPNDAFKSIPFGPQRCRNVGSHVLDAVEHSLLETARHKGGPLTADDIQAAINGLREAPRGLWSFYKDSFFSCLAASRHAAPERYERKDLFLRLMTLPFEHRFPEHLAPGDNGPALSRALLGPLETTLGMMLGHDDLAEDHAACAEIYDDLLREEGDEITWSAYYHDPRAQAILVKTCAALAARFRDFDSRRDWFVDVMNKNLDRSNGADDVTEQDIALMFTCLLGACRTIQTGDTAAPLSTDETATLEALAVQFDIYDLHRHAADGAAIAPGRP